jgi:hypothetical protein
MRQLSLFTSVAILLTLSAQQLLAVDIDSLRKDLSSPNVMTRVFACQSLGNVGAKDQPAAVNVLLGALEDVSGSVRLAAVVSMGRIGPAAAKAIPKLIKCYQRDTVSKSEVVKVLGRIGPDSPEAVDFLTGVVRGGKGGAVRPLSSKNPPMALRQDAIDTLGRIGPKAKKCIPVLLDITNITALDLVHYEWTFKVTIDALSSIGVGDRRVLATLKRYQQGKGFDSKGPAAARMKDAIIAADSAVKRLEQAEDIGGQKRDKKAR